MRGEEAGPLITTDIARDAIFASGKSPSPCLPPCRATFVAMNYIHSDGRMDGHWTDGPCKISLSATAAGFFRNRCSPGHSVAELKFLPA